MPRRMPRFDRKLSNQAKLASGIVRAGEIAHITGEADIRREWNVIRLEALYELAYLRVFAAWEACLEAVFYRSLCGFASAAGQETLIQGGYYPNLAAAESAVLGTRSYVLWHNPQNVIDRCRRFIKSGRPGCPSIQEITISSNLAHLFDLASTRHRIVHDQADAKRKFDMATLQIAGRTYASSRPGKFLRDWDKSTVPHQRWLDSTIAHLTKLASQIV
jgi:hypothetical protein